MDSSSSPFPLGWIASGPNVLWGLSSATYALIPYEILPPLPSAQLDGSFGWLADLPLRRSALKYDEDYGPRSLASLPELQAKARRRGLTIPEPFVRFVSTPALYRRVPSITACFIEFSTNIIDDPSGSGGGMLRFLNDSQGCASWYLYMTSTGDHCVLASWEWHDGPTDEEPAIDPARYFWCGSNLEHFLYRFWLEDEIWGHVTRGDPLPLEHKAYLAGAIAARPKLPEQLTA